MALITCPECGKKISDTAVSCPHCGFRRTHKKYYVTCDNGHQVGVPNPEEGNEPKRCQRGSPGILDLFGAVGGLGTRLLGERKRYVKVRCPECRRNFPESDKEIEVEFVFVE